MLEVSEEFAKSLICSLCTCRGDGCVVCGQLAFGKLEALRRNEVRSGKRAKLVCDAFEYRFSIFIDLYGAKIVGDPLTVIAGVLREPFPVFLLLVSVAKIGRYIVVAAVTQGIG